MVCLFPRSFYVRLSKRSFYVIHTRADNCSKPLLSTGCFLCVFFSVHSLSLSIYLSFATFSVFMHSKAYEIYQQQQNIAINTRQTVQQHYAIIR